VHAKVEVSDFVVNEPIDPATFSFAAGARK